MEKLVRQMPKGTSDCYPAHVSPYSFGCLGSQLAL
jgi:hypothetical protein